MENNEEIKVFQKIYQKSFGEKISTKKALERMEKILSLYRTIYKGRQKDKNILNYG